MTYMRWRHLLPSWVRVVPLELPGRGTRMREPACEDFMQLTSRLYSDYAHMLSGRYALFGYSTGALLAYGMARQIHAHGGPLPSGLLVGASGPATCRNAQKCAAADNDEPLIADLCQQGSTPRQVFESHELMQRTLHVLRADYRACNGFACMAGAPLPVPIHAFGGRHDDLGIAGMEAWRTETSARFTLDWFDGGHFFVREQEETMLAVLVHRLAQSISGTVGAAIAAA